MSGLGILLDAFTAVVFVSILGSWMRSDNEIFRLANRLTAPVLAPIRKVVPSAGGFDFSAMILLVGLQILRNAIGH